LPWGERFRGAPSDDGRLLVVDDTVASGLSMQRLKPVIAGLQRPTLVAVVYASPEATHLVDLYAEPLPLPHYLEWNFFNSIHSEHAALDFDGVLCEDCPPNLDDDGAEYRRWLASAPPKHLPRKSLVPLIATGRVEKYRAETESWLARYRLRCRKLVMAADRREHETPAPVKARAYAESSATIFVESCAIQAKQIAEMSGKRVMCPATAEIWN
jgi:hypothetical protein